MFAIYDGHGGSKAAQYCRDNLLQSIAALEYFETDTALALTSAFERINTDFSALARKNELSDGSTAVVAVINNRKLTVANGESLLRYESYYIVI